MHAYFVEQGLPSASCAGSAGDRGPEVRGRPRLLPAAVFAAPLLGQAFYFPRPGKNRPRLPRTPSDSRSAEENNPGAEGLGLTTRAEGMGTKDEGLAFGSGPGALALLQC